jgi:hypothetical protein
MLNICSIMVLSVFSIVLGLSCLWAVHLWSRTRLDRYEQLLHRTYISHFESRTVKALELHASLGRTLGRSKAVLERIRDATPEAASTRAALEEVSELLEGVAKESDCALRELEGVNPEAALIAPSRTSGPRRETDSAADS